METLTSDPLIGARLEQYKIERLLGIGGMARVYLARDTSLGREVAIKALAPAFLSDETASERFRREAQRVAALDHPNIAPVLHMIEHEHRLYLVMPLFIESLRERLRRAPYLETGEATRIVSDIGSALEAAHAHGLVHRDVKPGNILLDQQGRAYLCDFGIACKARVTNDADTVALAGSGAFVGTPLYMAPEQLCDAELDHRADIYALGVVLYQALTGRTPHTGNSLLAVATSALTGLIIPPSALNPAVTPSVERVILRALSRRPEDRYASVMRFVEALQSAAQTATKATTHPLLTLPWRHRQRAVQPRPAVSQRQSPQTPRSGWAGLKMTVLALTLAVTGGLAITNANNISRAGAPTTHNSQSAYERAIIPVATDTPTVTATQTPAPKPTTAPRQATAPLLAVSALRLVRSHGNQCSGSQTITNHSAQTIAWQWQAVSPAPHPSLVYGVNTSAQLSGLPTDSGAGVAPGGADTLNVTMKCAGQSYTVTLRDSLGRTQRFTITSDASGASDTSGAKSHDGD